MKIDLLLVDKLAHLSRLSFSEEEKLAIQADLTNMVGFVEQLQEVNTAGVEPLLHISDAVNVLRKDSVEGSVSREEALLNAPVKDQQFFKVPKVISK